MWGRKNEKEQIAYSSLWQIRLYKDKSICLNDIAGFTAFMKCGMKEKISK